MGGRTLSVGRVCSLHGTWKKNVRSFSVDEKFPRFALDCCSAVLLCNAKLSLADIVHILWGALCRRRRRLKIHNVVTVSEKSAATTKSRRGFSRSVSTCEQNEIYRQMNAARALHNLLYKRSLFSLFCNSNSRWWFHRCGNELNLQANKLTQSSKAPPPRRRIMCGGEEEEKNEKISAQVQLLGVGRARCWGDNEISSFILSISSSHRRHHSECGMFCQPHKYTHFAQKTKSSPRQDSNFSHSLPSVAPTALTLCVWCE